MSLQLHSFNNPKNIFDPCHGSTIQPSLREISHKTWSTGAVVCEVERDCGKRAGGRYCGSAGYKLVVCNYIFCIHPLTNELVGRASVHNSHSQRTHRMSVFAFVGCYYNGRILCTSLNLLKIFKLGNRKPNSMYFKVHERRSKRFLWEKRRRLYLFFHWASGCPGTFVIGSWKWIVSCHLLPILSPLAAIDSLIMIDQISLLYMVER